MFGGLDDPDQAQAAQSRGAGAEGGYEGPDVGHLVCDADAACEEENGTVGGVGGGGTVGAGGEGGECEWRRGSEGAGM